MRILNTIGKNFFPKVKEILNLFGNVDYKDIGQETLDSIIHKYDVVVVGLGLTFHKETLKRAGNLKVIATPTTGLDHIDIDYAQKQGIKIVSLRGENDFLDTVTGTAELAFGLLLDSFRKISESYQSVKEYKWERERFQGYNTSGKTLGIVGLGRLGKMMARYGNAFGMKVIAHDPYLDKENFSSLKVKEVNFDKLLNDSDAVSIHVHLVDETKEMFSADEFTKMKPGAYLINTSRGRIVNEHDLIRALEEKRIAGYATDVLADELFFDKEGLKGNLLVEYAKKHPNVIITPHIGGMTIESREATDIFIAQKVAKILTGR